MKTNNQVVATLEAVVLRGIQGQFEDHYLLAIQGGDIDKGAGFFDARQMAEQVYASWHKGWTR